MLSFAMSHGTCLCGFLNVALGAWSRLLTLVARSTHMAEPVLEPTLTGEYSIDNAKCYADRYTDLKGAFGYNVKALIAHYSEYGMKEGRTFNCNWKDPLADYPSYETCCGSSNSKWENGGTDIVLPVDTSGCGWTKGSAPMYFTSMSDTTCGAELFTSTPRCAARAIGYQGIYDAGVKGFTVKAKPIPGTNLPSPADAANYNWQVCQTTLARGNFPCIPSRLPRPGQLMPLTVFFEVGVLKTRCVAI
jgi:hypothetical protein